MKPRVRSQIAAQTAQSSSKARHILQLDFAQTGMIILDSLDHEERSLNLADTIGGAYVKVQPTVRASERGTIDKKAIRERLLARGACAVVVDPIVIPDVRLQSPEKKRGIVTSEAHLREWFANAAGARKVVDKALKEALMTVTEAGL